MQEARIIADDQYAWTAAVGRDDIDVIELGGHAKHTHGRERVEQIESRAERNLRSVRTLERLLLGLEYVIAVPPCVEQMNTCLRRGLTDPSRGAENTQGQLPREINRKQGLGLGLTLVRRLVQHLRGEFRLESRAGVGTTAYITLPIPPS